MRFVIHDAGNCNIESFAVASVDCSARGFELWLYVHMLHIGVDVVFITQISRTVEVNRARLLTDLMGPQQ